MIRWYWAIMGVEGSMPKSGDTGREERPREVLEACR